MSELSIHDNIFFKTRAELCNKLFDANVKSLQRCPKYPKFFKGTENEKRLIWFPKMFKNKDWENTLDGDILKERDINGNAKLDRYEPEQERITFAQFKEGYKFIGVYCCFDNAIEQKDVRAFKRVKDVCWVKIKQTEGDKKD